MTTQSSQVVAIPPDPGYAPEFAVHVDGQPLGERGKDDVLEIHVVLDLDQMASFDITFNNWDDELLRFKYSESEASDEVFKIRRTIVAIQLGYADKLISVVSGPILSLSPAFPESGAPTIRISGTDMMQKLKDSKPRPGQPVFYQDKADWQIVEQVVQRATGNIQVDVPDKTGPQHHLVVQKNQDDASFLMERAKRIDYDCYVTSDAVTETQTLHFGPPTDGRNGDTGPRVPAGLRAGAGRGGTARRPGRRPGRHSRRGQPAHAEPDRVHPDPDRSLPGQPPHRARLGPADQTVHRRHGDRSTTCPAARAAG